MSYQSYGNLPGVGNRSNRKVRVVTRNGDTYLEAPKIDNIYKDAQIADVTPFSNLIADVKRQAANPREAIKYVISQAKT